MNPCAQVPICRGRYTAYFGNRPYTYGRITHEPRDYPECDLFTTIQDKMTKIDPDFSYDKYTCLVTHYPDGKAFIPTHSDDETQIQNDSTIFSISVGASRTLRLTNTLTLDKHDFAVPHGSVYSMSSQSQSNWRHEILRDNSSTEPRISFTFRHLTDPPTKNAIPPIKRPEPVKPTISTGSKHRVLFLTDSTLSTTPEYAFDRVTDHQCIKKINYRLTDIFNFDAEFAFSKFVLIACGVNDMSRYGLSAHALADMVTKRLTDTCNKHTNTMFVFSSVLHTSKHKWLNGEIDCFNQIMFELSTTVPNLRFLDMHQAILNDLQSDRLRTVIDPRDKHGVHLTLDAKKLATYQLVSAVELIVGRRMGLVKGSRVRGWSWPLRQSYVTIFREIADNIMKGVVI